MVSRNVTGMPVRILLIEDDRDAIELVDELLMAHGYVSLLATNGKDGLQIAALQLPDLILLDIRMPGLDGYAVAAAIRQQPGLEHTRIVAVTASEMAADPKRLAEAGFDGYIPKPIDPENFVAQIEGFLPG